MTDSSNVPGSSSYHKVVILSGLGRSIRTCNAVEQLSVYVHAHMTTGHKPQQVRGVTIITPLNLDGNLPVEISAPAAVLP
jgi:hypothetical protein